MNKEMIVSSNGHETMVAILEDDLVAEIFVERARFHFTRTSLEHSLPRLR